MAFIEKLDGPALKLSPEEFEGYMLRKSGPCTGNKRLRVPSDTQHLLEELSSRQDKVDQGIDALSVQLQKWVQSVHSQLDDADAQFAAVQQKITAQGELPHLCHEASQRGEHEEPSVLELTGENAGPKDTDC